jgi:uncharacterized protein (DUF58 family)
MLLVDMSGSLDLGSRQYDKRHLVARLAATFAFSAIRNNDRVGLIGFTDRVEVFVPPRSGRKHVLAVVSRVLSHEPEHRGTDPSVALEYLARLRRGHSVAILISDFVGATPPGDDDHFERSLKLARRRHDVIPIRVEDPVELDLPALGLVAVEDLELLDLPAGFIDLTSRGVRRYREEVASERNRLDRLLRRLSLQSISLRCGEDWQGPLVAFFARRARRMRR